jgi:hypothetical protein
MSLKPLFFRQWFSFATQSIAEIYVTIKEQFTV